MKHSEDIKMEIGGKFINDKYKYLHQLVDDLNKLCKQVQKEQLKLYGVSITLPDQKEIIYEGMELAKQGKLLNDKASIKDYLFGFIDGARYIKEKVESKGNEC